MAKYIFLFTIILISSCRHSSAPYQENTVTAQSLPITEQVENNQKIEVEKFTLLAEIDLSKIGHIAPVERVQDKDYNQLKVVEDLIANGKDSIPFLIDKLKDETKVEGRPIDFWGEVTVGDIAHIILSDFFQSQNGEPIIKGVGFYEFLDCKNPKETPANNCLYEYIEKHGRKGIKTKWQSVWEQNKDKIYWDENERCFKLKEV